MEPRKWSGRAVARWLGVTHTYIQKLAREFATNPSQIERDAYRHFPATFEQLRRAKEETQKEKERGELRRPRRWRKAEFKIGGDVVRTVVLTKAEERRRAAEATGRVLGPAYVAPHELPLWARGFPTNQELAPRPQYNQRQPADGEFLRFCCRPMKTAVRTSIPESNPKI